MCTALQQSELFNSALARLGRAPTRLDLPSGPVFALRRYGICLASRPKASAAALAQSGVTLLNAEAPPEMRAGFRQLITGQTIAEIDLRPESATLLARMHPKWRQRLLRAQNELPRKTRLTERAFRPDSDGWLLKAERAQARARRYRSYPPALTLAMAEINAGALRLFAFATEQTPQAAMLFVLHGTRATYHIGWSSADGRSNGAHWLLLWDAMQSLKARGIETLELGNIDTQSGSGLARFKLGSGAMPRTLGGTWARFPRFSFAAHRAASTTLPRVH